MRQISSECHKTYSIGRSSEFDEPIREQ